MCPLHNTHNNVYVYILETRFSEQSLKGRQIIIEPDPLYTRRFNCIRESPYRSLSPQRLSLSSPVKVLAHVHACVCFRLLFPSFAPSPEIFVFRESMSSSFFIAPYHYSSGTLSCARVGFTWVNAAPPVPVINCHWAELRGAVINLKRMTESGESASYVFFPLVVDFRVVMHCFVYARQAAPPPIFSLFFKKKFTSSMRFLSR